MKTWKDFLEKPVTLGGQGPSSEPDIFARLYKNVFGAPIKLVAGYPGTNEIMLAMERGEVDGLCGLSWSTIKGRHAHGCATRRSTSSCRRRSRRSRRSAPTCRW